MMSIYHKLSAFSVGAVAVALGTIGKAQFKTQQSRKATTALHETYRAISGLAVGLSLCLLASGEAKAASFTFTKLADTSSTFSNFFDISTLEGSSPINKSGTVAFVAELNAGGLGIFTGNGGPITTISTTGGRFLGFNDGLSINNSGTVAFAAGLGARGSGVFIGNGGPITTIAASDDRFGSPSDPSINNLGTVAFYDGRHDFNGSGTFNERGVFTGSGGATTTVADFGSNFFAFSAFPSINDAGTVAFQVERARGQENFTGIFTGSGGSLTTIASSDDSFSAFNFFGNPSINNGGTVAFVAVLDAGGSGIFTGSGGPITAIVTTAGPFSGFARPSINNEGDVAFDASLDAGGSGIFTGPDPVADKVIATGDTLFGSTVTRLSFLPSLNDAGQVAFLAKLADGKQVIVRADPSTTPKPVPESSSVLGVLSLGALGTGSVLRRKWKSVSGVARNF